MIRRLHHAAPLRGALLGVGLALGVFGASPLASAQDPDPSIVDEANAPIPVRIELVIDTLAKTAQADVAEQFRNEYAPLSRKYGLYDSDDAELVFRFEFGELDKTANVYVVVAEATYRGELVHRDEARTCVNCIPADLVSDGLRVVSIGVELVRERRIQALMAAAESAPTLESVEPSPAAEDSSANQRRRALGPVGYVGVASTVLGVGTGVAGAFVLDRGVRPNTADFGLTVTDYRTPGQVLLGVGFGLVVVGTALQLVDVTVLAQRRRSSAQAKLDGFAVTFADHTTGFAVRGRF